MKTGNRISSHFFKMSFNAYPVTFFIERYS